MKCQKFGIFFPLFSIKTQTFQSKYQSRDFVRFCTSFVIAKLLKMQLETPDEHKCKLRDVFFLQLRERGIVLCNRTRGWYCILTQKKDLEPFVVVYFLPLF